MLVRLFGVSKANLTNTTTGTMSAFEVFVIGIPFYFALLVQFIYFMCFPTMQVKVTPSRCKNRKLVESREPTEVVMAPFSGKSIVLFEDVPLAKTAKRLLRIINPSEDDIVVRK